MDTVIKNLLDKLSDTNTLAEDEWVLLIDSDYDTSYLFEKSVNLRKKHYGTDVYIRGLIEISNYCKNNCRYCGIRKDNAAAKRYRLSDDSILSCIMSGYEKGFRTFVLQGGEDPVFSTERVEALVKKIKNFHPDCAVTLSLGERSFDDYRRWFEAGADRYLLRHETADKYHYGRLHPTEMSFENRMRCLSDLKEIGYQVGCGFMVGSPYQTAGCLAKDMVFISKFKPHMIGIGPFISHKDTEFANFKNGSPYMTLKMIALLRLACPSALIPATTALATVAENGRELGLMAGANVLMPNLSPGEAKEKYILYDNKANTGLESADSLEILKQRVSDLGYNIVVSRGDSKVI